MLEVLGEECGEGVEVLGGRFLGFSWVFLFVRGGVWGGPVFVRERGGATSILL